MAVSRLLKSGDAPASRPRLSSFCTCCICCSMSCRSRSAARRSSSAVARLEKMRSREAVSSGWSSGWRFRTASMPRVRPEASRRGQPT
ncbi:MAG: hypothetical protein IPN91_14165 [Holophagaceae bacterium]|uniref:Uncharacterized protein n=1 Tax=Candidatus Geothrix odensensis TaxID=2954440 RepID=A0A936F420_9BACT|nr:hypothetical protein [Candidatus Geothrix odensensis]